MAKILIVDDSPVMRQMMKEVLSAQGHVTQESPDASGAMRLINTGDFDLLIIDIIMPGTTGIDLIKQASCRHPGIKILVVTAVNQNSINSHIISLGLKLLHKPFEVPELICSVNDSLEAKTPIPRWPEDKIKKALSKTVGNLQKMAGTGWALASFSMEWSSYKSVMLRYPQDEPEGMAVLCSVNGSLPFTTMLILSRADAIIASSSFIKHSFAHLSRFSQMEEIVIAELGNMLLNSFVGVIADTTDTVLLPSAPRCAQGTRTCILEAFATMVRDPGLPSCVLKLKIQTPDALISMDAISVLPAATFDFFSTF